jgi:hypothetical protein
MAKGIRRYLLAATLMVGGVLAFCGAALGSTHNALWQMEDPTQLLDSSGNGNDGTTANVTSVDGVEGNGYHFDGAGSIATVPSSDSLNPGSANFTITANVRFNEPPSAEVVDYDLVRKGLSGSRGGDYKMEIFPTGKRDQKARAFCFFKDSSKNVGKILNGPNLADGAWHQIVCQKTNRKVVLVVDGQTFTERVRLGSISNSEPVTIGAQTRSIDFYNGDMDEVSIGTLP